MGMTAPEGSDWYDLARTAVPVVRGGPGADAVSGSRPASRPSLSLGPDRHGLGHVAWRLERARGAGGGHDHGGVAGPGGAGRAFGRGLHDT